MFILAKPETDGRKRHYVAKRGLKHSYTTKREHARQYETRAIAKLCACGNESIIEY